MVVNRDRVVIADTNIISYAFKSEPLVERYRIGRSASSGVIGRRGAMVPSA
jgi:hypothetical protein